MGRYLAVAAVVVANAAVAVAAAHANQGLFGPLTLLGYALLAWTAYLTGRGLPTRTDLAVVAGTALAAAGLQIALAPQHAPQHVSGFVVFTALPLLVGRYLAQHRRLVRTLDAHNRQLSTERALLAEQEQLRERLRIARDMHDSLGRRLSLVSVQAAALEVSDLPPAQRQAVTALAGSARDAVTELYQLIGSLRGAGDDTPGAEAIPTLVEEFRTAGVEVSATGNAGVLPPAASRAAYRVIEEGLTNATKHAAGHPVAIHLTRETDTLVVTVANPVTTAAAERGGFGLVGLTERVDAAGGFLDHRVTGGEFRLVAMLPTRAPDLSPSRLTRGRVALLGVATAVLLFVLLPAITVTGVAGR
ncbi:sensor histidine kinase [Actinophytocola sp.]|uniref:sensor histidine kinase n=1 Tax=Actinophytocola sp. TaxID=1872138 RepID=UPI00389B28A6